MKIIPDTMLPDKKANKYLIKIVSFVLIIIMTLLFFNIMLSGRDGRNSIVSEKDSNEYTDLSKTEEEMRLENILSCMEGVGNVQVMIRNDADDEEVSVFSSESGTDDNSVDGVIVVAEGAENAVIKSTITDAVATLCKISPTDVYVFEMRR